MRIAMLHSTIRGEEKLLIEAAKKKKIEIITIDIRKQIFNPKTWVDEYDVVLERSISTTLGRHAILFFESMGMPVVNSSRTAYICENKFESSLKLVKHKVPTVAFALVFTEEQAIKAIDELGGYPVVVKPVEGSWGRLLGKINDQDALEAVIEQKMVLGSPSHKAIYIQKYVDKKGRDIRVNIAGDRVICAIYRESEHWITNTARGAMARECKIDDDLRKITIAASNAVGGGVLGIDIFETNDGYIINEVNHTTEFKNVQRVTGVNVAGFIIDYCKEIAKND